MDALLQRCRLADGRDPLNDHLAVALHDTIRHDTTGHDTTATTRPATHDRPLTTRRLTTAVALVEDDDGLVALALAAAVGSTWVLGLAVDPARRDSLVDLATPALGDLLGHIASTAAATSTGGSRASTTTTDASPRHSASRPDGNCCR